MEQETIKVFIRKSTLPEGYEIVSKTKGYPSTQAHDETFPEIETAREIAQGVAKEIQDANPEKQVKLQLYS